MTAKDIVAIVGIDNNEHDHQELQMADQFALAHLAHVRGALMSEASNHLEVFEAIAKAMGDQHAAGQRLLAQFPTIPDTDEPGREHIAGDVACNTWLPQISAAYYFGLALGLRLAGGAR